MTTLFGPIRTLVVDDSKEERDLLRAQLARVASVKLIFTLEDGFQAVGYLQGVGQFGNRRLFPYPELMLLDFQMPRCNGMQVLEHLRYQPARPFVVLWSNNHEQIDEPLALRLGADLVCAKPNNCEQLEQIIHRLQINTFGEIGLPRCDNAAVSMPLSV
jgi:CheY-like chemotaxis protein